MECIDLFAGLGGRSTGARMAGAKVLWAANHLPVAVEYHQRNHSSAKHVCQDLHQADWSQVPGHDLMLASPCCQGHSNARGKDSPQHDASRSTAWAVISAAEYHRSPFIVVENVKEFLNWSLYPSWEDAMNRLGYTISPHIIDAADHGVAQNRVRMFLICSQSKYPIKLNFEVQPDVHAFNVIDLSKGNWSQIDKPKRSKNTLAQIQKGREDLEEDLFLIPYYGSGSGLTGRSIHRPIGTITTVDRWAVIYGDKMRMLTVDEKREFMGFPEDTILPSNSRVATHLLGNAVCPPVDRDIITELMRVA